LVRVRFVAQPYDDQTNLREFLVEVCGDARYASLACVVAWAKRSGLSVVADDLRAFSARGESILLVGIDQGGATKQGLAAALDLFSKVYVVHDRGVTFHPKVYLAEGDEAGRLFVGSTNLTAGGLQANYEAALDVELDFTLEADRDLRDEVHAYVTRLVDDGGVTLALDEALLDGLAGARKYRIQDEDAAAPEREPDEATGEGTEEEAGDTDFFGTSGERKRGYPARPAGAAGGRGRGGRRPGGAGGQRGGTAPPTGGGTTAPATGATLARRWFKTLPNADAQHPARATTKVTGALRLTKAKHPINVRMYFRDSFFGGLPWAADTRPLRAGGEAVEVDFTVSLPGQPDMKARLLVAHDTRREAGQRNFSTSIHWGDLMPDMRATDYTGYVVTLERYGDDSFRLVIAPAETGPFVA
jgi:hypothetical protein